MNPVKWQLALLVGAMHASCGCGQTTDGDGPGSGGVSGAGTGGSASYAGGGGGTGAGADGGRSGVGGSVTSAGSAGRPNQTGASGAAGIAGAGRGGAGAGGVGAGTGGAGGGGAGAGGAGNGGASNGGAGNGGAGNGGTAGEAGAPSTECAPGTGFLGQLTGPGSAVPNGGIFTTDPSRAAYGDANLDGVIAAYPDFDAVWAVDVDVQGAVVTATAGPDRSAAQSEFWIADDNAVLKVALDPALGQSCCPDFDVRTGMRISFKVKEVSTFIRLGQITVASNFVAGTQGNCVLVAEPAKITDVDFYQMVRVSAQLSGEPMAGDGANWWHLGLSDVIMYDFLSPNLSLQTGQTITFVGPVSPYVGYHMLVESNPDWVMVQD